ncbi:MAG: TIGR03986 family CRISPR-associated RAMP protein [Bacteroidetes bacterium]|jgi:CRISPR-associated protein (TIGR03986 family)|nr:TIGR03986 family CRISPR-associated RAMP protein [Bacteroidota bacterium]
MQTASLSKRNNQWYLKYRKGNSPKTKEIAVGDEFNLDDAWDGKEVEISFTTAGVLETIKMAGMEIEKQEEEKPVLETRPVQKESANIPYGYRTASFVKKHNGIELYLDDAENYWVPAKYLSDISLVMGEEVFIKTSGSKFVESILSEGDEIIKPRENTRQRDWQGGQQRRGQQAGANNQHRDVAEAPYNFVPINDFIVAAKKFSDESIIPPFDRFVEGHHSGYIDLKIEAKTKVFIGSGSSETGNYKFFAPNGTPRIPGSSLRGMVRTLVEICSWAQFKFFEDKQLFYRTFENSSMGIDFYRKRMVGVNGQPKVRAGYLRKDGRSYKIIPALCDSSVCDTEFYRIEYSKARSIFPDLIPFKEETVFFQPEHVIDQSDRHSRRLDYALLSFVSSHFDSVDYPIEGKLIASGNMPGRHGKHLHWVINLPEKPSGCKEVNKDVIHTYQEDANRKITNFDLLSRLKNQSQVPCFYLEENGEITAIGHSPYFRLPYQNKIGDLLPHKHKEYTGIDIPTAIFGNESTDKEDSGFAGRVYFEDALFDPDSNNERATTHRGQATAISPKPTSFQLYLKQDSVNVEKDQLKHYDYKDENENHAELRGNKLYWHKKPDPHRNNTDKLQFNNTRIRFTNLNSVELGALLFVLDLPEGCCHKIGMGKPQGLGSIRITPTLYIDNHQKKYASFTAAMQYKSEPKEDISSFKETFENYIKEHPGIDNSRSSLWDHERMKQLKALLNYDTPPRNTGYMPFMVPTGELKPNGKPKEEFNTQFKERFILPKATEVK